MRCLSIAKTAMCAGATCAVWAAIWTICVAAGWAQSLLAFVFELHFIRVEASVTAFSLAVATSLIALSFCAGALMGATLAIVWNWISFEDAPEWARETPKRPFKRPG